MAITMVTVAECVYNNKNEHIVWSTASSMKKTTAKNSNNTKEEKYSKSI